MKVPQTGSSGSFNHRTSIPGPCKPLPVRYDWPIKVRIIAEARFTPYLVFLAYELTEIHEKQTANYFVSETLDVLERHVNYKARWLTRHARHWIFAGRRMPRKQHRAKSFLSDAPIH